MTPFVDIPGFSNIEQMKCDECSDTWWKPQISELCSALVVPSATPNHVQAVDIMARGWKSGHWRHDDEKVVHHLLCSMDILRCPQWFEADFQKIPAGVAFAVFNMEYRFDKKWSHFQGLWLYSTWVMINKQQSIWIWLDLGQ